MATNHIQFCLFVLEFYGPVNNKSCRAGQLIVALFLGRLRPSKRLTSTKRGLISDLDKIHMNRGGLFKKHFRRKKI